MRLKTLTTACPACFFPPRHKYWDTNKGLETTVHPSYFWSTVDEDPNVLPEGSDQRLDSWGNLPFVDHHTRTAVREDPRIDSDIDKFTGLPTGWHAFELTDGSKLYFSQKPSVVVGTYDPSTMTSKSLKNKDYYVRPPKPGEDSKDLLKPRRRPRSDNPIPVLQPPMSVSENEVYYELFERASKAQHPAISLQEAQLQCSGFLVPSSELEEILRLHDTNYDRLWNVDEYSNVLHTIKLRIQGATGNNSGRSLTTDDRQKYCAQFEAVKHSDSLVMSREEMTAACSEMGLSVGYPGDFVSTIIDNADYNKHQRWNVDEIAEVMHRITQEVERKEALRTLSGPIDSTLGKKLPDSTSECK